MENAARAQQRLKDRGYAVAVDGDFGAGSYAALMCHVGGRGGPVRPIQTALGRAAAKYFAPNAITSPLCVAHLLAQQAVETGGFTILAESLNYSAAGLRATFGPNRISAADCTRLGRKPGEPALGPDRQAEIANLVYGGSFGAKQLGNTQPGDGWRYRGRGAKQTTGRANYALVAAVTGIDVVADPDLLADPDMGMRAAVVFWDRKGCGALADADDILDLTRRINGGTNGIDERRAALARAKAILI